METSNIAKGTFQIALTNAFQYLVMGLFYVVVTKTNALTPTDLGVLSILSFLASTFSLLTGIGLPTALTKFASENLGKNQQEEATAIQKTVARAVLILSTAGFAIATLSSGLLSQYFWKTSAYAVLIIFVFLYAFLFNITTLCNSTLQAFCLFGRMAMVSIVSVILTRTIGAILALLNMSIQGVLIGYIAGSFIAVVAALNFLRGKLPETTHNVPLKPLLHFGLPLFLSSLTLLVLNWADIVIIASMTLNYSLAGIYYIVVNSVSVLSILWIPITTTIFPALSAQHGLKNPQGVSCILKITSRYLAYIIFPSCLGLATIAPTALTFFYGPDYASGATPLALLSIATIILSLYSLFITALTTIEKTVQILKINTISALSSIIMLLALVPFLEATGAAVARLATQVISLTLATYTLRKEIKVQIDREALWKSALASISTIPFLFALELTISSKLPPIETLAVEIITAAGIYALSLYALKALNNQDFELLRQTFPKPLTKYIDILESIIVRP